jgi:carbon-monoxide dehydrogenase large subunit
MAEFGIGTPTLRVEDFRLVRGLGRYVDDVQFPGATHMVVVRSPHAAARIVSIDTQAAREAPGVLSVLTGADVEADGLGLLRTPVPRKRRDGSPMRIPPYRLLATDQVRLVGDAVAIVIAETLHAARDAAELVAIDYETQPSVTDIAEAVTPGAAVVWPDLVPDNVSFVVEFGDKAAVAAAFARAAHTASLDFRVTRVSANTLEPRNAVAVYDEADGRYTLYSGMQAPHKMRSEIAESILNISPSRLRVVSPDVGGGFGMKGSPYPEYSLALWAAHKVGRPVRWVADRTESFLSDYHARDNVSTVELALDSDGIFIGLRVKTLANLGAYLGFSTPHPPAGNIGGFAGVYRTPAIHAEILGIHTHTQPTAPYRGAGRPEATYAIERIIDIAAAQMGIDRVELRRRNLIPASAMPFKTPLVFTYDCGEFEQNMDMALEAADWKGFPTRRAEAKKRGLLRGIGIANPIEVAGGPFRAPNEEAAALEFDQSGEATIRLGTHSHGQGHETAFRQLAVAFLGLDPERIRVVYGDTDAVAHGRGTFGSRSLMVGGAALRTAADKIISRGREIAAHVLEADKADIMFEAGSFTVAGTDKRLRIEDVARVSFEVGKMPKGEEYGLSGGAVVTPDEASFPNGCHICEVEIDPETGVTAVINYTVVDDVGTVINPLMVKGQIHGGVAQGIGQIFTENIIYDPDNGQMLTASFMDYGMPRADQMPPMHVISNPVPTKSNPLGVKGAGEAGTVGAIPAVISAIVDALSGYGVTHIDMPATPERVWAAIRHAQEKTS